MMFDVMTSKPLYYLCLNECPQQFKFILYKRYIDDTFLFSRGQTYKIIP